MKPLVLAAAVLALHAAAYGYARLRASERLSTLGPLILLRTRAGIHAMAHAARWTRAWGILADLSILGAAAIALGLVALLLLRTVAAVTNPMGFPTASAGLGSLVGLPGVNPLIPLGFGLAALILAILVHEAGHGILVHAEGLRLRSTGIVILGVPIGAFVEPDPTDLARSSTRAKLRILAAGPGANLLLALIAGLLLTGPVLGAVHVANGGDGVGIGDVTDGSPAALAGIKQGDVLIQLAGDPIRRTSELEDALGRASPGETVAARYVREGVTREAAITLGEPPDARDGAYLGVRVIDLQLMQGFHNILADPGRDGARGFELGTPEQAPGSWILFLTYPILVYGSGIDVLEPSHSAYFTSDGPLSPAALHGLAALLYWTVWLNLGMAAFNALPIGPLDGGQMLRTITQDRWTQRAGIRLRAEETGPTSGIMGARSEDPARQQELERIQSRATRIASAATKASIILILLPALAPLALRLMQV